MDNGLLKTEFEEGCIKLLTTFRKALYGDEYESSRYYWIGDQIGGVFELEGRYFSVEDIVDYFVYDYTPELLDEWYEQLEETEDVDSAIMMSTFALRKRKALEEGK
jgi:hypothetical protein